jgi:hypothetical protein
MASIAEAAGITRIAVWKALRRAGVKPGRRAPPVALVCAVCGKTFSRPRHRLVDVQNVYCSSACYMGWIVEKGKVYRPSRYGLRLARAVVSSVFDIPEGAVVHHHDGSDYNNDLGNLAVFASHSTHMSFHRGGKGLPIWDGRDISEAERPDNHATRLSADYVPHPTGPVRSRYFTPEGKRLLLPALPMGRTPWLTR